MDEVTEDFGPDLPPSSGWKKRGGLLLGIVLLPVSTAVFLGGLILHFGQKADRIVAFPFAGRLAILLGILLMGLAVALTGRRGAIAFGLFLLLVGAVMFVIGMTHLDQPSRLCAPLGFFVSLIGGFFVWGGIEIFDEPVK